jgi:hypothetical protein
MTKRILHCLAGLILAAALTTLAADKTAPPQVAGTAEPTPALVSGKPEPTAGEKKEKPEPRIRRDTNGDVVFTLDLPTQQVMGLRTTAIEVARLSPELKGYGRVLDASPLMALAAELTAALATHEASQAELKRLQTLVGQNNASERALQAAEALATRDQTQVDSARLRLLASWGSAISDRQDLPSFARSLGALESVLVEVDTPAGSAPGATPVGARLFTLSDDTQPIPAQLVGPAQTVDPLNQGRGFVFLVSPNPAHLAPGQAVTGLLSLPGEPATGVAVPREAILRHNGATWVYRQTGDTTFLRQEITLERPLSEAWFVLKGLKPQDKVVVTGTQQLLSEELKGSDEGGD